MKNPEEIKNIIMEQFFKESEEEIDKIISMMIFWLHTLGLPKEFHAIRMTVRIYTEEIIRTLKNTMKNAEREVASNLWHEKIKEIDNKNKKGNIEND